jgi:hypothetical protein
MGTQEQEEEGEDHQLEKGGRWTTEEKQRFINGKYCFISNYFRKVLIYYMVHIDCLTQEAIGIE